jgi:hypothetical protein
VIFNENVYRAPSVALLTLPSFTPRLRRLFVTPKLLVVSGDPPMPVLDGLQLLPPAARCGDATNCYVLSL